MPEPAPRVTYKTPAIWPSTLPNPQADSMRIVGPGRVAITNVLGGPTRLRVHARTASMLYSFRCFFTRAQMQAFEDWYRICARDHDGEFYAQWIGGSRIVAFTEPYRYTPLGAGWALDGRVIRTRIDPSICDAYIDEVFGGILWDDGIAIDIVEADLTATDIVEDDYPLSMIERYEC